jgi:hypothetical protein
MTKEIHAVVVEAVAYREEMDATGRAYSECLDAAIDELLRIDPSWRTTRKIS